MNRSQLAINAVTVTLDGQNLPDALAAFHKAGFTQLEFQLGQVRTWLNAGHAVEETKALLDANGLTLLGGFELGLEVFTPPDSLEANLSAQVENARLIDALGGGMLVFGTDGPAGPVSVETLSAVAERVKALLAATADLNVTLGLEFNWGPVLKSLETAVLVAQLVDDPRVGVVFDTAHYHCTVTKFEDLTPEIVRWITLVHLNDMRDIPGDLSNCNSDRVLLGDGILPIPSILNALEQGGYTGPCSIELFNDDLWAMTPQAVAPVLYQNLLGYVTD
ncbi:MAG: sugar phosphate isomerase/epimerase family protein [Thermomicrobiales bacterium]